jgi:predicted Fe-Mo cluster-binding NifX family protein/membrane-associated protease RseP (regulator of RpoE activity)
MKNVEHTFCMSQFKPAIAGLAVLVVVVIGWTGWHCSREQGMRGNLSLAAVTQPTAPPIAVKDKMLHPYWGNCNKCHVTTGAGRPISKVMAAAPISIKNKMTHQYWGNCLLCHKVVDGFQPGRTHRRAMAAAANMLDARSIGLKVKAVTGAVMRKFGLSNEDGLLILEVAPGSAAAQAGLMDGDEILRAGKTRLDTANDLDAALNRTKPGKEIKLNIYRGKQQRNLFLRIPKGLARAAATTPMTQNQIETLAEQLGVPKTQQDVARALRKQKQARVAATTAPMTQNQVETLAEQLGVPKTQQDVTRALQRQKQTRAVANVSTGKVVVASSGPGLDYPVAGRFGASPYLILYDTSLNSFRVTANPNVNDATGRGVQTGQYAVDMGACCVVAGSFSQNTLHTLDALRVNTYGGFVGSVRDALAAFVAGTLTPIHTGRRLTQPTRAAPMKTVAGKAITIY